MDVIERVNDLIGNYLEENGIELIDITYKHEQGGMVLRLLVDTPQGVTIDACEKLNNFLSELLDKEETISEHYTIEVASPGLDRPIITDRDFQRVLGKALDITTYQAIGERKTHEGKLVGIDKESVVIESNGVSTVIPKKLIARARLKIEFPRLN